MSVIPPRPEELTQAMSDALVERIRSALRERILERIEPDIKSAIDVGMESFKATIGAWKDPSSYHSIIKVILEDRRQANEQ